MATRFTKGRQHRNDKAISDGIGSRRCPTGISSLLLVSILAQGIMTSYISIGMNSYQKEGDIAFDSSPEVARFSRQEQLPHWRMGTDCSGFSFDCFSVAQQQRKYKPYPFNLSVRKSIESNTTATHNGQWPVETIKELQNEWIEFLEKEDR